MSALRPQQQVQDAASVSVCARFYYPVRFPDEVLVYCVYEQGQVYGVDIHLEAGQPVIFARMRDAVGYCEVLNAQQPVLPTSLPPVALAFLLRYQHQAEIVVKRQRRFLVLPLGRVS